MLYDFITLRTCRQIDESFAERYTVLCADGECEMPQRSRNWEIQCLLRLSSTPEKREAV